MLTTKHKIYLVKRGETLADVAKQLGLHPQAVRNYHNNYCALKDLIEKDFPLDLKELILPNESSAAREISSLKKESRKEVAFGLNKRLLFKPSLKKINYGVMFTLKNGEETDTIKYEMSVRCVDTEPRDYHLLEINKISKTFINNEEANAIADELADKVAAVLYPLVLVVDKNGKWADVYNADEIQKRWSSKKQEIMEEYEGEWAEKYLSLAEKSLESRSSIKNSLQNDWFIHAFFNGMYVRYTDELVFQQTLSFPLLINATPVNYVVEQKISKYLDDYHLIHIEQKGILSDERAKADFENNSSFPHYAFLDPDTEKATGKYRSKYFLNPKDNSIETLFLECSIDLDVPKKLAVVISVLDEEPEPKVIVAKAETTENKKKGFFSIFKK